MVRPFHQRGFKAMKGELHTTFICYAIEHNGLESVFFNSASDLMGSRVYITVNDGEINSISYGSVHTWRDIAEDENREDVQMAKEVYEAVKKLLDVDEKLEHYNSEMRAPATSENATEDPKRRLRSERNLFDFLGINNASQIEYFA